MEVKNSAIFLVGIFLQLNVLSQQSPVNVDSLTGNFLKAAQSSDKERIILQTDRNVYAAGERIWFNAFLLRKVNNGVDTVSKNLYVDLVDSKDSVIARVVLNARAFRTHGALHLSDTINNGYYWLRSYTRKILNDNFDGLYIQPLFVINKNRDGFFDRPAIDTSLMKAERRLNEPLVSFYPEGGTIMTGINSTVGIKVNDAKGNPLQTTGHIVDNLDSNLASFTTNKLGLAKVTIFPSWYRKYTAVVHLGGQDVKYPLPSFNPRAGQLSVTEQSSDWIKTSVMLEDSIYSRMFSTTVIGISGGHIYYAAVGKGNYQTDIPVANFPGGVVTLLLFDGEQHLLSERKVFIDKENYAVTVQANKQNYTPREKVHLNMAFNDAEGKPLVAAVTVSIQNERMQKMSDGMQMDTLLPVNLTVDEWLKRDAKKLTAADIDLQMLAQPAEFKNTMAVQTKMQPGDIDETELLKNVHGGIINKYNQPLKGLTVTGILIKSDDSFFDLDTTSSRGRFRIGIPQNKDSVVLSLQILDKKGQAPAESRIFIDTFHFPVFSTPVSLKQKFLTASLNVSHWLQSNRADTIFPNLGKGWLTPVTVASKTKANYDESKRMHPFSHIITADQLNGEGGQQSVLNAVLGVPGVRIKQGFLSFLDGSNYGSPASTEPMVILDGAQAALGSAAAGIDPDPSAVIKFLNTLDPKSVEFIEVLTGSDAAVYGVRGANGVILVNSKSRFSNNTNFDNGFKIVTPITYHVAPVFNMPDYSDKTVRNNKAPDARNTIYWNGNLVTTKDGKADLDFYTADAATTYIVTITGITQKGDYVYKRISINRK